MTSRAVNPQTPYDKLTVGTAPDSWGVWFPEDDKQVSWQTFLDEVAEAGYEYIETGPFGFLPTDPDTLREEASKRGITVVAGTQFGVLRNYDLGTGRSGSVYRYLPDGTLAGKQHPKGAGELLDREAGLIQAYAHFAEVLRGETETNGEEENHG